MSKAEDFFIKTVSDIESGIDHASFFVKKRLDLLEPVMILPFFGFGNTQGFHLKGRVMEDEGIEKGEDDQSVWKNLRNMWKRYETDEIPGVSVKAKFRQFELKETTSSEGYFDFQFKFDTPIKPEQLWSSVELALMDKIVSGQQKVTGTAKILIPPSTAKVGVISDVDDTILVSHSTEMHKKAQLTFLNNARTRLPFKGVATFYQALQKGTEGDQNPIFYVSSSPWNLYDLLVHFCEVHDIPQGPFLLRDMGVSTDKFIKTGHLQHKTDMIEKVFGYYPELPFILIGDSGQKDVDIYEEMVARYPDKIKAIYIRDVTGNKGDEKALEAAKRLKKQGVDLILCEDTADAAAHAASHGFITQESYQEVKNACQQND